MIKLIKTSGIFVGPSGRASLHRFNVPGSNPVVNLSMQMKITVEMRFLS